MGVIMGKLSFMQGNMRDALKKGDLEMALNLINNVLLVTIFALFIFVGFEIAVKPKEKEIDFRQITRKTETTPTLGQVAKDAGFYLSKIRKRDIFKPAPKKEVQETPLKPPSIIDDVIVNLKLVGLSPSVGGMESYVMIENTKTEITYFLREGDTIEKLKVDKIMDDRILLKDKVQTRELK